LRYEIETHLKREEIFDATKSFFGEGDGGLGMKVSAAQGNQIAFFGDGLVWVTVLPSREGKPTHVDIDVSDREKDARKFIEQVLKQPTPK
jgi:hypothetical protein